MENMMGKCAYCGTEIGVMADSQAGADEAASKECGCYGSKLARKQESMKECLHELLGSGCEELGFKPVANEVYCVIENAALMALEGVVQGATFKVDGTLVSIKAGEKTKVKRKYTYEQDGEIE